MKIKLKYNHDGTYTIFQKGWSLTGDSFLISTIMEECFEFVNALEILKNYLIKRNGK